MPDGKTASPVTNSFFLRNSRSGVPTCRLYAGMTGVGLWLLSMQHEADESAAFDWTELFFML